MAYPPTVPSATRTNLTAMDTTHPADHNQIANALTDIVNVLGSTPAGASATVQQRLETIEANNWVTNARVADNAINTAEIVDGAVTSAKILDGTIVNADVSATAAITYGKLSLAGSIVNADLSTAAGQPGGAWNAWTPTLAVGTLGNGTAAGRYIQIGKTVYMQAALTWGTTSNFAGLAINLPVTAQASVVGPQFQVMYSNGGLTYYDGAVLATTTTVTCQATGTAGAYAQSANISNTIPFTWAAGSVLHLAGVYEAA